MTLCTPRIHDTNVTDDIPDGAVEKDRQRRSRCSEALLDGLFEQPLFLLSRWGMGYQKPVFEKFLNDSTRP